MIGRQAKLVRLLFACDGFRPAAHFAQQLGVSNKTIYADVDAIRPLCEKAGAELLKNPRKGILLRCTADQCAALLEHIDADALGDPLSIQSRRIEIARRLIVDGETLSLERLTEEYYVSKTSLYGDLNVIEKEVGKSQLAIISSVEGVSAAGDERAVQDAIKQLVLAFSTREDIDYISVLKKVADRDIVDEIRELIYGEVSPLFEMASDYFLKSLLVICVAQAQRIRLGHHMQQDKEFIFSNLRYMEPYIVANSMATVMRADLGIEYLPEDIEHLSRHLFAHRITTVGNADGADYVPSVREVIRRVSEIEGVDLSRDERLFRSLMGHIPAMMVRLKDGVHVENPLCEDIRSRYSRLFDIMWYALSILERTYGVALNDDEISLVLIYFQVALDRAAKAHNIVVVCPHGMASSQMVFSRLKQFLPASDNIEVAPLSRLHEGLERVDLVVSTVDLEEMSVPWVKVSALFTGEDIARVMQVYADRVLRWRDDALAVTLADLHLSHIAKFLDCDLVFIAQDLGSKEECLDLMLSELEMRGLVGKGYRRSVYSREEMGVTALASGVALPHAAPEEVVTSSISVVSTLKPIDWDGVDVSLVIMVSISESDIHEIRELFEEIYTLARDEGCVRELSRISNPDTFVNLFSIQS